jgi:hypothetical protein
MDPQAQEGDLKKLEQEAVVDKLGKRAVQNPRECGVAGDDLVIVVDTRLWKLVSKPWGCRWGVEARNIRKTIVGETKIEGGGGCGRQW